MPVSFEDVRTVAALLEGFESPWYVSGGWAIDLFVGTETRDHEDLEIGVARRDQMALQNFLRGWTLSKAAPSRATATGEPFEVVPWVEGEWLDLPIHQVIVTRTGTNGLEWQLFLNEIRDGTWYFRRNQAIYRPESDIALVGHEGIPIIAPEIQLLYKAKERRPKDDRDFATALPRLDSRQRTWLAEGLELQHPGHAWLGRLRGHGL
jgi:aminoglycoside-2''-adenylyltransferase